MGKLLWIIDIPLNQGGLSMASEFFEMPVIFIKVNLKCLWILLVQLKCLLILQNKFEMPKIYLGSLIGFAHRWTKLIPLIRLACQLGSLG